MSLSDILSPFCISHIHAQEREPCLENQLCETIDVLFNFSAAAGGPAYLICCCQVNVLCGDKEVLIRVR